jgi:hypothetical protein
MFKIICDKIHIICNVTFYTQLLHGIIHETTDVNGKKKNEYLLTI